jgi:hypothetical protein
MARTKKAARKQASNYSRETIQEYSKEKQEVKKSKHAKNKNKNKGSTSTPAGPAQDNTQITGSEPTDDMSIDPPATNAQNTSSADLASTHDISYISIISSSQIEKKVTAVLNHLSPPTSAAKPAVVILHSKAKVASKLISVVEIAKREIAGGGGKWFQYNVVEGGLEERERVEEKEVEGEEDEEEEESFEIMKTPFERAIEGTPKVRAVPGMTTYLSRVRIDGLRKKYG